MSPTRGAAAEPAQHVAADVVYVVLVDVQPELLVDVGDEREAVDVGRSVGERANPRRLRRLAGISPTIRSISDSNVTRPGGAAVFVDDERLADAAPAHLGQQIVGAQRLGHGQRFARERAGVDLRRPRASALSRSVTCSMPMTSSRSSR